MEAIFELSIINVNLITRMYETVYIPGHFSEGLHGTRVDLLVHSLVDSICLLLIS